MNTVVKFTLGVDHNVVHCQIVGRHGDGTVHDITGNRDINSRAEIFLKEALSVVRRICEKQAVMDGVIDDAMCIATVQLKDRITDCVAAWAKEFVAASEGGLRDAIERIGSQAAPNLEAHVGDLAKDLLTQKVHGFMSRVKLQDKRKTTKKRKHA